ncbi:Hypothetical predicted protein [Scomber scombrus]|uniref:Uncharacterized protein n=1 Tax=Scomber scombrus TaxID=13677 RepID=A0AAV1NVS0_SCOSC
MKLSLHSTLKKHSANDLQADKAGRTGPVRTHLSCNSSIVPAVEFQSFQEQWEALTSEERSNRCLSDKEVCRSHGEHTDIQQHYLQTCFVSVFCLVAAYGMPIISL